MKALSSWLLWNVQYIHRQQKPHFLITVYWYVSRDRMLLQSGTEMLPALPSPFVKSGDHTAPPPQPFPHFSNCKAHPSVMGVVMTQDRPTKARLLKILTWLQPQPGVFLIFPGKEWNDIKLINSFHWNCLIHLMFDLQNGKSCSLLSWTTLWGIWDKTGTSFRFLLQCFPHPSHLLQFKFQFLHNKLQTLSYTHGNGAS